MSKGVNANATNISQYTDHMISDVFVNTPIGFTKFIQDHDKVTKRCTKCSKCTALVSTWSCSCGLKYQEHITIIETRMERIQNGRATSDVEQILNDNMLCGPIGGNVQNFMDLVDGSERFRAQAEEYERNQLEYHHQNALGYMVNKGNTSKMFKNGLNMLGGPQSTSYNEHVQYGVPDKSRDVGIRHGGGKIVHMAQREIQNIDETQSALMLFKKPHRFGR